MVETATDEALDQQVYSILRNAILEAIRSNDSKLAAKRMKKHILRAFKDLPLDSLDEATRSFPRLKQASQL